MGSLSTVTIDLKKDRFLEYKYRVTEFHIVTDGNDDKFPVERIQSVKIENYYENASFPIFRITLLMEASRYYNLIKNKDKVEIIVRMQHFIRKYDGERKMEEMSDLRDTFTETFVLFSDDDNADYQTDLKLEANKKDDKNKLEELKNMVELFLFKKDWVTGLRSQANVIVNNADMTTTIAYLLNKAKVTNVLMSPLQNTKSYAEMVLPPQSIDKQLRYLNNNVGFHQYGTMIYFGISDGYILDCKGGCTAYRDKEWKESVFYITDTSNHISMMSNMLEKYKEERYYYNIANTAINIVAGGVSDNVVSGTDATIIDMKGNSSTTASSNAKTVESANKSTLYNYSSNPYKATVYQSLQTGNNMTIYIGMRNVNILGLAPNKDFTVIFENQLLNSKYKGTYRLASSIFLFNGNNAELDLDAVVELKKTVTP